MPDPSPAVTPDGSLGLLAFGYRGLIAWRVARGTDWLDDEQERYETAVAYRRQKREQEANAEDDRSLGDLDLIIVSGLPRSGTSMVMQMLEAGNVQPFTDAAREADASNPKGYYEHNRIRSLASDKNWVYDADGLAAKVVAPLLPLLPTGPAYRVILITRDLDEVVRSQRRMLERLGRPAADSDTLRAAYQKHLDEARSWASATQHTELLEISHAEAIQDPTDTARRIADFVGTQMHSQAMADVVTPSLHRERTS